MNRSDIFVRDGFRCVYCGNVFGADDLSVDHVQPKMRGGDGSHGNVVTACSGCNTAKGGQRLARFLSETPTARQNFFQFARFVWPRHLIAVAEELARHNDRIAKSVVKRYRPRMTPSPISGLPDARIVAKGYAYPERLVSTEWLDAHRHEPLLRLLECNEDVLLYGVEHIPGAQKLDWHIDLNDQVERDYVDQAAFQRLLRARGIDESTTVVFYGDKSNWWATYAFWVFRLYGFENAVVLDGGRAKWLAESRPTTTDVPLFAPSSYVAPVRIDAAIRAFFADAREHQQAGQPMIDVRSPQEYTGEKLHMPDYPQEGTLRGGHIPGARSVPWGRAAAADGSFKPIEELRTIYENEAGLSATDDVVTYCRIGERSSHTWFVLTFLLGYPNVRNYDGSWTEWGNAVRAPIRRGEQP